MAAMNPGSPARSERPASTELLVVRHGESMGNVEGRFGGHGPTPLTERGKRQARAVAAHLAASHAPTRLIASDLPRARETALAVAEATGLPLVTDPGLRERSVGCWDDMLFTEVAAQFPEEWELMNQRDYRYCPPGGETIDAVFARVGATIERVVAEHPGERIVLVSHGIAIYHLFAHVCGLGSPAAELSVFTLVDNASLSRFRRYPTRWRILTLNETAHLPLD
jgi:probable phosphoglycerate mutase